MSVIETPAITWQEKAARARQNVEKARTLLHEAATETGQGVNTSEKYAEARRLTESAHALSAEVKSERKASDADVAKMLLEKFEIDDGNESSNWVKGVSGGQKGLVSGLSEFDPIRQAFEDANPDSDYADLNPANLNKSRIRMGGKAAGALGFTKALAEGTSTTGGFLVPPEWMQELFAETRRQGNALRRYGWLNVHPVTDTNQILLPRGSGAATVGWVAENAPKPSADQAYSQVTINIYTLAGISKLSKQLVDDSSPTAIDLATRELASLMAVGEEQAVLYGTAAGMPRGILNTTGTNGVTAGTNTAVAIIDALLDAIVAIQTTYYGAPNGVLMHPRRLAFLQKARDSQGNYLFNFPGSTRGPGGGSGLLLSQAPFELLGLPVGVSANMPTNIDTAGAVGGSTGTANRDAIVVADWNEAHWFQRQEQTLDTSGEAGTAFEDNQIWFRLEERAGFSAERYPAAFSVLTGAGLVP